MSQVKVEKIAKFILEGILILFKGNHPSARLIIFFSNVPFLNGNRLKYPL